LNMMHAHKNAKGFSLVELLIAMTLGLILISSMVAVFSGNKRSSEMNSATADLQESARFAVDQMGQTVSSGAVVHTASDWKPKITGFTTPVDNPAKVGSHVLMIQYGGPDTANLTEMMTSGGTPSRAAPIPVDNDLGLEQGDLALISNCEFADLFQVTAVADTGTGATIEHDATGNESGAVTRAYGDAATLAETLVMKFHSNIYYVGESGETNESGDKLYSLFQQTLPYDSTNNPPVELVTGVENMRISYGQRDPKTDGVRFLAADHADFDPLNVDSIRLGILMVSYDQVTDTLDSSTYMLAGHAIEPAGAWACLLCGTHRWSIVWQRIQFSLPLCSKQQNQLLK